MTQSVLQFKYEEEKIERGNKRFGQIEVAIGCDVTRSFKDAVAEIADTDWHPHI